MLYKMLRGLLSVVGCFLLILSFTGSCQAQEAKYERSKQTAQYTIAMNGGEQFTYWVAEADFGPRLPDYENALEGRVMGARDPHVGGLKGCGTPTSPYAKGYILFAERGNCTFAQKAKNAKIAGAKAIIIVNSVGAMYQSANASRSAKQTPVSQLHVGICDYDCRKGESSIDANDVTREKAYRGFTCGSESSCPSQKCVLTKKSAQQQQRQVCCISDDLMRMGKSRDISGKDMVPAVFTKIGNSKQLYQAIQPGTKAVVMLSKRWVPVLEPSSVFLFVFAVLTLGIAGWRAAAPDRDMVSRRLTRMKDPATGIDILDEENLSLWYICGILSFAAIVLVGLYILIQYGIGVVLFVQLLFILSGTTSWALLVFKPLFEGIHPGMKTNIKVCCFSETTRSHVSGLPVGLTIMLIWYFFRFHSWSWILQDATGVVLVTLIMLQVRLPSLRFISALLWAFFLYDVFMVFITPLLVGDSVMVEVATAGQAKPVQNWECYCRLNPHDKRHCGKDDFIPILLRIPTLLDYRRGDSMLGLGDLVIPGLLFCYVVRYNVWNGRSLTPAFKTTSYFTWLLLGYAFGLAMANIAIYVTGMGQPALLYLVPLMLLPTYLLGFRNGELRQMWKGERPSLEWLQSTPHENDSVRTSGAQQYTPLVEHDDEESDASSPGLRGRSNGNSNTIVEMHPMRTAEDDAKE
eukprot:gb/GECG01010037.1/.p1 GENE.gb/GECG01010037.1/~~gb/GECG01010037.1/.p1  ORF type:complete len:690 (+),score=40.64 gb/GECG01010037.1/:1-2070(+)